MINADKKLPVRFTGKHGERYYYKGAIWFGPSNMIGSQPIVPIQPDTGGPWGLTVLGGAEGYHVAPYLGVSEKAKVIRPGLGGPCNE